MSNSKKSKLPDGVQYTTGRNVQGKNRKGEPSRNRRARRQASAERKRHNPEQGDKG